MPGTYIAERKVDSFRSSTERWLIGSFAGWLTILSCLIGVGLIIIAVRWLQNRAATYEITDQRLIVKRGLIMKSIDEIELYRVKDVRVDFSLLNQISDIGTITITSTDRTSGDTPFVLRDIPAARERREGLRKLVDRARQLRGVARDRCRCGGSLALARTGFCARQRPFRGSMAPPTPQIVRVIDLETTGSAPPAHGVCEIGWQDVALGKDGRWELEGEGGSILVNPGRAIPPITQAIHHILDEQVADAPWWHDVARRVLDPYPRRLALAAHRADFEQQFCTPALTHGAEWICTWKCALRLWPDSPSFSNQVLRYWRKPHGLDHERGLPIHRAFPDAYVTAHHLRDQLNEASLAQLLDWSRTPGLIPRVRYGPDRGKDWRELDHETLMGFLTDRDPDIRFTANHEMDRRRGGGEVGKATAQDLLL